LSKRRGLTREVVKEFLPIGMDTATKRIARFTGFFPWTGLLEPVDLVAMSTHTAGGEVRPGGSPLAEVFSDFFSVKSEVRSDTNPGPSNR